MARPLRVEYPGAFYHVINRGNNQENIIKNDRDIEKFLEYLQKANERFSNFCHAYCLMSHLFHLLVETSERIFSRQCNRLMSAKQPISIVSAADNGICSREDSR